MSARAGRVADPVSPFLRVWAILVYAFLFLPIAIIVVYAFNAGRALIQWGGFGFDGFEQAFSNPVITDAVRTSLTVAVGAATIATVLGSLAGIALARRKGRWTVAFLALLFLILVTPEIVDGIALLIWYVRIGGPFGPDSPIPGLNYGLVRLWTGHSLFASAVVTLIVRARLTGLDESLEEAGADLYAPPFRRFRRITLPLMLPAVLAGGLLAFSLSLDDVIISSFVSAAGNTPWPVVVFSAVRSLLRPEFASMSAVLLAVTLVALALVAVVLRRSGSSSADVTRTLTGT
jgi:putrescine transport system permease protein